MQAKLKREHGRILARKISSDPWIRLPTKLRASGDVNIQIAQWINPETCAVWWVLDRIRTSMLCSNYLVESQRFWHDHGNDVHGYRHEYAPRWMTYNHPVLLHAPDFRTRPNMIALLSTQGAGLSGSNIYNAAFREDGGLCLGDAFDPLTVHPVELIISNLANNDLIWQGNAIEGDWSNPEEFIATSWPTTSIQFNPPPQISVDLDAWLQS